MAQPPVVNQQVHHPARCSTISPAGSACGPSRCSRRSGLRPRHLVALTVLRGRGGITQQALVATLEMDGTNIVGLLNELEAGT